MKTKNVGLPKPKFETKTGKRLTDPSRYLNPKEAVMQYAQNTIENKQKQYYEEQGYEMSDFHMMTKLQKLDALAEAREKGLKSRQKLRDDDAKNDQILTRAEEAHKQQLENERKRTSDPGQGSNEH